MWRLHVLHLVFLFCSDIDLVVFGQWKNLPLRTLYNALVEKKIVELDQIKVLDKASVSAIFCCYCCLFVVTCAMQSQMYRSGQKQDRH